MSAPVHGVTRQRFEGLIESGINRVPQLAPEAIAALREFASTAQGCGSGSYEDCPVRLAFPDRFDPSCRQLQPTGLHSFALAFDRAVGEDLGYDGPARVRLVVTDA